MPVTIASTAVKKSSAVERRFVEPRQVGRSQRDHDLQAGPCRRETRGRARDRQQHAFRQQLRDDLPAAGAERGSHRDFAATHVGARELEIGDVRTREQQHEPDGPEEDQQRSTHLSRDEFLRGSRGGRGRRVCRRAGNERNLACTHLDATTDNSVVAAAGDTPSFNRARPEYERLPHAPSFAGSTTSGTHASVGRIDA